MAGLAKIFTNLITGGGGGSRTIQLPPAPTRDDPSVEEARIKALKSAALQRGRGATLVTGSPRGDESPAPVQKARLLGGNPA